ncbi:MAG: hypothetical protein AB7J28_11615 [Hyphomonadaceae bacterium]
MRFAAFLCASLAVAGAAFAQAEERWSGHGISLTLPEGWRATTDPARSEIALIARSLPMEAAGHTCEVAVIPMAGILPHDQELLNNASTRRSRTIFIRGIERTTSPTKSSMACASSPMTSRATT